MVKIIIAHSQQYKARNKFHSTELYSNLLHFDVAIKNLLDRTITDKIFYISVLLNMPKFDISAKLLVTTTTTIYN